MEEKQQQVVTLITTNNNVKEASDLLLSLPLLDHPLSYFQPIFNALNGLQRINLFKALLAGHPIKKGEERKEGEDDEGYMLRFFLCLRPSEHGVVMEDMEAEEIEVMLKRLEEDKKVAVYELLPYHIVEKIVPILTVCLFFLFSFTTLYVNNI